MVLIDLKNTPGITIKSIKTIAGDEEFAEEIFDQVKVPFDNLVGEIDKGCPLPKASWTEKGLVMQTLKPPSRPWKNTESRQSYPKNR